jgi:hypothetical protein
VEGARRREVEGARECLDGSYPKGTLRVVRRGRRKVEQAPRLVGHRRKVQLGKLMVRSLSATRR